MSVADIVARIKRESDPLPLSGIPLSAIGKDEPVQDEPAQGKPVQGFGDLLYSQTMQGVGHLLKDPAEILERAAHWGRTTLGNSTETAEEFHNSKDNANLRNWQNLIQEKFIDDNDRYLEPQSAEYYLGQILNSAPESLAIMAASTMAGRFIPGAATPLIAAGNFEKAEALGSAIGNAARQYLKGNSMFAKGIRNITPATRGEAVTAATAIGAEAQLEKQNAIDYYMSLGHSRDEAEEMADGVALENAGLLSLTTLPQYRWLFGSARPSIYGITKPTKGLLGGATGRIGKSSLTELTEEVLQDLITQLHSGLDYDPQSGIDSAIVGALMGAGFQGSGEIYRKATGQPSDQELWDAAVEKFKKDRELERATKYIEHTRGEDLRGQANYNAAKEQMRGSGIDTFMRAIGGQESGDNYDAVNYDAGEMRGKYQIDVDNWSQWAQDAGLPADAPMTPENQEIVARNKMLEYYNKFGNWRDVAIAWYGGERAVNYSEEAKNKPQYANGNEYPSINEYAESVMTKFRDLSSRDAEPGKNNAYLGENGKGEGKYWERNPNMSVSLEGAHPDLPNLIDMLAKFYYDKTGKRLVINAGTNGDHADGEHSHKNGWKVDIVDAGGSDVSMAEDGPLFTADYGKGWFLDDFIAYGRSLGAGMNIEGLGTGNVHVDVALDGTQWDGNGENAGGFNPNVSTQGRADQLYNESLRKEINDYLNPQARESQARESQARESQEEQQHSELPKPPQFDINDDNDSTTQRLIAKFARDRYEQAIEDEDADTVESLHDKFKTNGEFINTPENRKAVREKFGDDSITEWSNNQNTVQTTNPETQQSSTEAKAEQNNNQDRTNSILHAGENLVDKLAKDGKKTDAIKLRNAIRNGNIDTVENVLRENGIAVPQEQPQPQEQHSTTNRQDPVNNNKPPENVLGGQDKATQKLINVAKRTVAAGKTKEAKAKRAAQGVALSQLAQLNGIQVDNSDITKLIQGDLTTLKKVQTRLKQAGIFEGKPIKNAEPSDLIDRTTGTTILNPDDNTKNFVNKRNKAYDIIQRGKVEHTKNVLREREADEANDTEEDDATKKYRITQKVKPLLQSPNINTRTPQSGGTRANSNMLVSSSSVNQTSDSINSRSSSVLSSLQDSKNKAREQRKAKGIELSNKLQLPQYSHLNPLLRTNAFINRLENGDERAIKIAQRDIDAADAEQQRTVENNAKEERLKAGQAILDELKLDKNREALDRVLNTPGLKIGLEQGSTKAIQEARRIILEEENKLKADMDKRKAAGQKVIEEWNSDPNHKARMEAVNESEAQELRELDAEYDRADDEAAKQRLEEEQKEKEERHQKNTANRAKERVDTLLGVESKNENAQQEIGDALNTISDDEGSRVKQGKALSNLLNYPLVKYSLEDSSVATTLKPLLEAGDKDAIIKAQDLLSKITTNPKPTQESVKAIVQKAIKELDTLVPPSKYPDLSRKLHSIIETQASSIDASDNTQDSLKRLNDYVASVIQGIKNADSTNYEQGNKLAENETNSRISNSQTDQSIQTAKKEVTESIINETTGKSSVENQDKKDNKSATQEDKSNKEQTREDTTNKTKEKESNSEVSNQKQPEKITDEQINEAAQNPDIKNALEQLGAKVEDGKVTFPDVGTREVVENFIETQIAWHGSPYNFDEFSTKNIGKGQTQGVYGWGLYFAKDKKTAEGYKQVTEQRHITFQGHEYLVAFNTIYDISGNKPFTAKNEVFRISVTEIENFSPKALLKIALEDALINNHNFLKKDLIRSLNRLVEEDIEWFGKCLSYELTEEMRQEKIKERKKALSKLLKEATMLANQVKLGDTESHLYKVSIPADEQMLDANKPLSKQIPKTRGIIEKILSKYKLPYLADFLSSEKATGDKIYKLLGIVEADDGLKVLKKELSTLPQRVEKFRQKHHSDEYDNNSAFNGIIEEISHENLGGHSLKEYNPERASRLLNEAGIKGMFAEDKEDGQTAVVFDDKTIKILEKFSLHGSGNTDIKNFVNPKDLTPAQRLLSEIAQKLGVRIVFFRNENKDFHGAFAKGITFLNVNSKMPLGKVFWHESLHWLKANNAELYQRLVKAVGITEGQRQAYLEKTGRTDLKTRAEIDEEILADQFFDAAKRTGLLQSIAGKNRGLIQRVVQWLKDTMNKFIEHFRNPQGKLTTEQAKAFAAEFGKICDNLVDEHGEKIFRYNRRTGDIEVIDGRKIEDVPFDENELEEIVERAKREGTMKYSIGTNDNSSKSFTQKVRNYLSGLWNGNKKPNRNAEITKLLSDVTGYKVDFGNIKGGDQTIIDDVHKIIRATHAYEWEKLLPQIGGKIAKSLKLSPTQEMNNYIAEWCLTGAVGNYSPESKDFAQAMSNDPLTRDSMMKIRNLFQELQEMTAEQRIEDTIVSRLQGKSWKEKYNILKGEKEEQVTDDLHPVLKLVNDLIAKVEKTDPKVAKILKEDIDPYKLMRLLRGISGLGNLMIAGKANEIEDIRNKFRKLFPRLKFDRLVTLDMIVDMAGGKEHVKGLMDFAIAKFDKDLHEYARTHPDEDIRPQFNEADDDEVIKRGEKQYGEAHRALVTYSNILTTIQHDAGLISDKQYSAIMNKWSNYVPMYRVFDPEETINVKNSLKTKTGSKRNTYDIYESLVSNTYQALSLAERNRAKQQLAFYSQLGEFGDIIQEVEASNTDKKLIVTYKQNGQMKYLKVFDPAVVRAVNNIYSPADTSWLMKTLNATMGIVRSLYTVGNYDFAAGNIPRDMQDAFIHGRSSDGRWYAKPFITLTNMARLAFDSLSPMKMYKNYREHGDIVAHDEDWVEFNAFGGAQSSFVAEDIDQIRRSMNQITRKTLKERFSERPVSTILETMQWLSEQTEYITRMNTYKRVKADLAKQHSDGKATLEDMRLAALNARDASTDFAKAGTATRQFNKVVLFANAQIQDLAKWGVVARDLKKGGEARKVALQKIYNMIIMGGVMTLLQAACNALGGDDWRDKYKKRPDWEKETYWILGAGLRIPKGQDFGTRFVSALTDESLVSNDPVSTKRLFKVLRDALPSIIPSIIEPWLETQMNYARFREAPIVPIGEQNLLPQEQYGKNTSILAVEFGRLTGTSPRNIDHLVSGYLGTMGKAIFRTPDLFAGRWTLNETPMLKRFVFSPAVNTKVVKDYYEALDEQGDYFNTYKLQRRRDKTAKPLSGYDAKLYMRLKSVQVPLRKISVAENNILRNPNFDWETKNKKIEDLEKKRERLCEKALQPR